MPAILLARKVLTIVGVVLILSSSVAWAERSALEWSEDIRPGLSQSELKTKLTNLGVQVHTGGEGLTYTSKLVTDERDYLFVGIVCMRLLKVCSRMDANSINGFRRF